MVISSVMSARAGVNGDLFEAADLVEKAMVALLCDRMCLGQGEVGVRDDLGFGPQAVADPTDANRFDHLNAGDRCQDAQHVVDKSWVHTVHEAPVDVTSGVLEDEEDGDGDEQPGWGRPVASQRRHRGHRSRRPRK